MHAALTGRVHGSADHPCLAVKRVPWRQEAPRSRPALPVPGALHECLTGFVDRTRREPAPTVRFRPEVEMWRICHLARSIGKIVLAKSFHEIIKDRIVPDRQLDLQTGSSAESAAEISDSSGARRQMPNSGSRSGMVTQPKPPAIWAIPQRRNNLLPSKDKHRGYAMFYHASVNRRW